GPRGVRCSEKSLACRHIMTFYDEIQGRPPRPSPTLETAADSVQRGLAHSKWALWRQWPSMSRRRQPSLSTALAVVRALALMRIELALNGLPGLFDGGVRPELSITGFTDADERGPFRHDSQIAFCHAQVSHGLGHHISPVDIQTAPLPAVNGNLSNFDPELMLS